MIDDDYEGGMSSSLRILVHVMEPNIDDVGSERGMSVWVGGEVCKVGLEWSGEEGG